MASNWAGCVVSTAAGDAKAESRDGKGTAAGVNYPYGLTRSADGKSISVADSNGHRIRRYDLSDDRVSTILGTGTAGCANGGPNTTTLHSPQSVCTDPLKPNNLYIGDYSSIRYSESGITSLIAGSDKAGYLDGSGVKSQFVSVSCLLCHSAGKKLYAADRNNNRIRLINTETDAVTTIAGDGKAENRDGKGTECSIYYPRHMVFDRSPNSKPETVLLITAVDAIRRFDTETGVMTTLKLNTRIKISPWAMDYTPSGHLIVGCTTTHSLYVINPVSGDVDRLAGTGDYGFADGPGLSAKFHSIYAVQIISERQFAIVSDVSNHRLRRVTLPPHLFIAAGGAAAVASDAKVLEEKISHAACEKRLAESKASEAKLQGDLKTAREALRDLQIRYDALVAAGGGGNPYQTEVNDRPANEWSAGGVIYWVENVFAREHKTAQISEFVKELKARAQSARDSISGQRLLGLTHIKPFVELKLTDLIAMQSIQDAIDTLKAPPTAKNIGFAAAAAGPAPNGSSNGAEVTPP